MEFDEILPGCEEWPKDQGCISQICITNTTLPRTNHSDFGDDRHPDPDLGIFG